MAELSKTNKIKKILNERAALLAQPKNELSLIETASLLVFEIGIQQRYGIPYIAVDKVIPSQKTTPIPGANALFSGIIYHNSEAWPVVNSCKLFHCNASEGEANLVLLHKGPYRYAFEVGTIIGRILYDESVELMHLHTDNTKKQPFVLGIYESDISLVDIAEIFNILNTT